MLVGPPLPEPPPLPVRREYPNPPIVEGLVQFNFAQSIPWNVATPGRIFERLQDSYPADPEQQGVFQAGFGQTEGAPAAADFTVTQAGTRVIYRDSTRSKLIVINDKLLSINSVQPYEGWEKLSRRIAEAVAAVSSVVDLPLISDVSVRYINTITLPAGSPTEKYVNYEIRTARSGSSYVNGFMQRVESAMPDGVTFAATTFASAPPPSLSEFPILLDIEFRRNLGDGQTIDEAIEVAHELKVLENAEFESVITDEARKLFQ